MHRKTLFLLLGPLYHCLRPIDERSRQAAVLGGPCDLVSRVISIGAISSYKYSYLIALVTKSHDPLSSWLASLPHVLLSVIG